MKLDHFKFSRDDPLASEHADVAKWIEEAVASLGETYWQDVDLKSLSSGQRLLRAKPEQSRRYVLAAVAQARHWDKLAQRIRAQGTTDVERMNPHLFPGWNPVWGRRRQAEAVVSALMRRALPFQQHDLLAILQWCNCCENLSGLFAPIGHISRALQRYASEMQIDSDLREAMKQFAARLRSSYDKDAKRYGTTVEQLCVDNAADPAGEDALSFEVRPAPTPTPGGCPAVLEQLKRHFGMLPSDALPPRTVLEPDQFALRDDSPLRREHVLLSDLFEEVVGTTYYTSLPLREFGAGRTLLALKPTDMGRALLAASERSVNALLAPTAITLDHRVWQSRYAAVRAVAILANAHFDLQRDGLFDLLLYLSARPTHELAGLEGTTVRLISQVEREAASTPLTEGERYVLWLLRASLVSGPPSWHVLGRSHAIVAIDWRRCELLPSARRGVE